MPSRRSLIVGAALLAGGVALGVLASGGTADPTSLRSEPVRPVRVETRPATNAEVAAAKLPETLSKRPNGGGQKLRARISTKPIKTEPGTGDFVGLDCPQGFVAVSGGAHTGFINLTISQSAPIHPRRGTYTPRTWWVAVTNDDLDGMGATLEWTPVVNCMNRLKVVG